jgi:hypothetical protein
MIENHTGLFFDEQTTIYMRRDKTFGLLRPARPVGKACRENAEKYRPGRFRARN